MAEVWGVALPSYADEYATADSPEAVAQVIGARRPQITRPVPMGFEAEGDGIVFCIGGAPWHCGYVISPGIMLHARRGCETAIERYTAPQWNKRIEGIYRCKS